MNKPTSPYFHFAPPLLGDAPIKLKVLFEKEGLIALEKPPGLLACSSPCFPEYPSIEKALQLKSAESRPSETPLSHPPFRSIFSLDPDYSACALFSNSAELIQYYRNAYGSNQFSFTFKLLVEANTLAENLECSLPIFQDSSPTPATISHKYGKKAHTQFRRLECLSPHYQVWQAQSTYLRPYQLRLHAQACGLRIVGEMLLDSVPLVCLSSLKRRAYKGLEKPLYPSIAIHLSSVQLSQEETVSIPLPKPFQVMMDKICQHARGAGTLKK